MVKIGQFNKFGGHFDEFDSSVVKIMKLCVYYLVKADSLKGKSGPTGCGGVLHDTEGCILTLFSGPLGVLDSNMIDLQVRFDSSVLDFA
ncbi:hypothetical protein GQ457_02G025470 [Hibiscus cannabinus]